MLYISQPASQASPMPVPAALAVVDLEPSGRTFRATDSATAAAAGAVTRGLCLAVGQVRADHRACGEADRINRQAKRDGIHFGDESCAKL